MQGVILAAGNGKRLKPFTLSRSKAMAPILGEPIVVHVIKSIQACGISDFVLVVSHQDQEIIQYFNDNPPEEYTLTFAYQEEKLGMAHALGCAAPYIHGTFVLSACDSLVDKGYIRELIDTHTSGESPVTLGLLKIRDEEVSKRGVVKFSEAGRVVGIVEKPTLADAPSRVASIALYVFEPEILSLLPKITLSKRGEYELQDGIQMLINKYNWVGGAVADSRAELTNLEDLRKINMVYLERQYKAGLLVIQSDISSSSIIHEPVKIDAGVTIGSGVELGPYVYLESGCVVEAGAKITNSVVLKGGVVKADTWVIDTIVL